MTFWTEIFLLAVLAQNPGDERTLHWQEDLRTLSAGLKAPGVRIAGGIATRGQKDFARLYPNFDQEISSIQESLPDLSDAEVTLRLMRLMASAHVAHNSVQTPVGMGFARRLPVTFRWFADGPAIVAATPEHVSLIGARVLGVGAMSVDQYLAAIEPYLSHENDAELRLAAAALMNARAFLEHFRLEDSDGRVALHLEKLDGARLDVAMPLVLANVPQTSAADALHLPTPIFRSHPKTYYWHEYLPDVRTLFIQYNVCENDPNLDFGKFVRQVEAEADGHPVKNVVVDLRWNGGGNSRVIGPLLKALAARRTAVGRIYALIGPATFSSGVLAAADLRRAVGAKLVGEGTGGMPGGYGEVSLLKLPNSKLTVRFTTKNFGKPDITTMTPDILAPIKLADFLAGRDPGLEAAIHAR